MTRRNSMYYLTDFARPKGSKDKVQRKKRNLRIREGAIGALLGGGEYLAREARNKKVWNRTHKGKAPYTLKNVAKGAILPSLIGAGIFLGANEINNRINEKFIKDNYYPFARRKQLKTLYRVD